MSVPCLVCLSVSASISVLSSFPRRPSALFFAILLVLLCCLLLSDDLSLFVSRRGDFTDSQLNALIRCHQSQSQLSQSSNLRPMNPEQQTPFPFAFLFLIIPFAFSVLEFRVPLPFLSFEPISAGTFVHCAPAVVSTIYALFICFIIM